MVMQAETPEVHGKPDQQGLYNPANEHDACGVGFVANIKGVRSHSIVEQALQVLANLEHRGACGCDPLTSDGSLTVTRYRSRPCADWPMTSTCVNGPTVTPCGVCDSCVALARGGAGSVCSSSQRGPNR